MEQYLKDQYKVIEHDCLESYEDIKGFFNEYTEIFECGQGFYEEEKTEIVRTKDGKFYEVKITAEIGSAKQDRGDRLYWVESIESVEFKEIDKPKEREVITKTCRYCDHWKPINEVMGECDTIQNEIVMHEVNHGGYEHGIETIETPIDFGCNKWERLPPHPKGEA